MARYLTAAIFWRVHWAFREVGGRGSHRVFAHPNVPGLVNLQVERGQAKRYQVRRVVGLVRRYGLSLEEGR